MKLEVIHNAELGVLRVAMVEGVSWFVLEDVEAILSLSDSLMQTIDGEDKAVLEIPVGTEGIKVVMVNTFGLYSLIQHSNSDVKKVFKHWVTTSIIPALKENRGCVAEIHSQLFEIRKQNKVLSEIVAQQQEILKGLM